MAEPGSGGEAGGGAGSEETLVTVTFDDVAFYFSEQEWEILQTWQKGLYQQVMQANCESLDSTGCAWSKADLITWIEQGRMLLTRDQGSLDAARKTTGPCTDEPLDLKNPRKSPCHDNQGTFRAEEEGCHFSGLQEQDLCASLSEKEKENSSDQRTTLHSPGLQEIESLNPKLNLTASSQAKQAPWPEPPDVPGHLEVLPGSGCYSCCVCREVFEVKRDLAKHQRSHSQRQPYQHPLHRDKSRGNWELGRSPVLLCRKKRFQCSQCEKSYYLKCSLITHQVVHTGQRPFPCPECGKTFRYKADLKKHPCLHQGERAFRCAECGKGFIQQCKLTEHIQVHKKPFQYLECDRSYCTWRSLKAHLHTQRRGALPVSAVWQRLPAEEESGDPSASS
ncbi:zinc finger protein 425-like [Ochotona princeps]|uniref:zinc finger protein 425-like n=1 Tax=Ochotona princeps TaxID=9978 RepID=UPI0027153050|nr:zinc finger protein 425-like [Ochotona princeps]